MDGDPQHAGQPGPGPPGQFQADPGEHPQQRQAPPQVATRQALDLLGKRDRRALQVAAHQSPDRQADHHRPTTGRAIGHRRAYRLCTRADQVPQHGHAAPADRDRAKITTASRALPLHPPASSANAGKALAAAAQAAWQTEAATRLPDARDLGRPPCPTGASLLLSGDPPRAGQIVIFRTTSVPSTLSKPSRNSQQSHIS